MQAPIVSIITPSYNQGKFIRATIESVLSQDYSPIEYIVMDGGSSDETASVVKDYGSRLTFISERDRGQSHAINKGFRVARGSIVAWLNSDDVYLPGAVRTAVRAFAASPSAGAIYGDGYVIDREGRITGRFPHTIPENLWKLKYVSDYILQQSLFFRKAVLDDIGYLDEGLEYSMDWEILIRIGKKYSLAYIPEYMGCIREYAETKSSAGGARRVREIRDMLRLHTGRWMPPGYVMYSLGTYHRIWCERIGRRARPKWLAEALQYMVKVGAGLVITYLNGRLQGLYDDGWAAPRVRYMVRPGSGSLIVEGAVPEPRKRFKGQVLTVSANGRRLGRFTLGVGDFSVEMAVPSDLAGQLLDYKLKATRWVIPERFRLRGDHRRLAYRLKGIRWGSDARPEAPVGIVVNGEGT